MLIHNIAMMRVGASMCVCLFASSGSHSKGIHCPLLQIHIRSEFAGTGDTCPSAFVVHGPVGWEGRDCLYRRGEELC